MTSYTFVRRGPQRNGSHSAQKRRAAILAWQQQQALVRPLPQSACGGALERLRQVPDERRWAFIRNPGGHEAMKHTNLPYLGRMRTPRGVIAFWRTGVFASPVDMATSLGLQTAVANAPTRDTRRRAEKQAAEFIMKFGQTCGVYAPGATTGIESNGEIVVSVPWYEDTPPEKWPEQELPKLTVFDPNKREP